MLYNNFRQLSTIQLFLFLALVLPVISSVSSNKAKIIQDVPSFTLVSQTDKYQMAFQVAHHNFKLTTRLDVCRSWIKQGLCKVCNKEGEQCSNTTSCFSSAKDPRISCDSAFCSRNGEYEDSTNGLYGIQTQIFCTIVGSEKVLMPLILATKIDHLTELMGEFCLLDSDSSFKQGLLVKKQKKMQVINTKVMPEQSKLMRDYSFRTEELLLQEESLFGKATTIKVSNPESQKYKEIEIIHQTGFKLEFSLEQIGISMPINYLKAFEKQLLAQYFPENSCRLISGKIKCRDQLNLEPITDSIFKFQFANKYVFSLPLHLLFTSCAEKECGFLLTSHNKSDTITVGTIIWETLALEWDVLSKKIWVHRLNNHWAVPYKEDKMDFSKKSFLSNMITFLYHIFLNLVYLLLGLGLISILINFLVKWSEVLRFLRGILLRIRGRKQIQIGQTQREDEYFVGSLFDERQSRGRRINRLPEDLQDQL